MMITIEILEQLAIMQKACESWGFFTFQY